MEMKGSPEALKWASSKDGHDNGWLLSREQYRTLGQGKQAILVIRKKAVYGDKDKKGEKMGNRIEDQGKWLTESNRQLEWRCRLTES
jgi:hypothetical protein